MSCALFCCVRAWAAASSAERARRFPASFCCAGSCDAARAADNAVKGAAAIESRSGKATAWKELYRWLDALPEPLRPDIAAHLPEALRAADSAGAGGSGEDAVA